ncbi:hypothetical protein KCV01_g16047, partial [Aureobasidium melanogenum]
MLGNAAEGKAGESIYVNAANGNLVIRDQDEMLLGQGLGAQIFRSYNSRGDGWHSGATPTIGALTGTLGAAGSTVSRTDWDGSVVVYSWDAVRQAYVSLSPAAANQALTGDGTNWTLRDDRAHTVESYDATTNGRLVSRRDLDGNTTRFEYNAAGLLSKVTTGSQESVSLVYDAANRLVSLSSVYANASGTQVTATRTRYGYDDQGRLSTVTVDLSPEDNSIADGDVYTTTYTYDGTSNRIVSLAHGDGTSVSFTYRGDAIASVTQHTASGVASTTSFDTAQTAYGSLATIKDALGNVTGLSVDANGQLIAVRPPAHEGVDTLLANYAPDQNGRVTVSTAYGVTTAYTYDAAGNLTRTVDSAGNVVDRTYGEHGEVLSEWRYTAPIDWGAGTVVVKQGPVTTQSLMRYTYDDHQHLRFAVTAEGRVTEYRYNAAGQQVSKIVYSGAIYPIDTTASSAPVTVAALNTWMATIDKSQAMRTDFTYDFRGQLAMSKTYDQVRTDGTGVDMPQTSPWKRYIYDAHGRLIQVYNGDNATVLIESDTYDGLGRITSTTSASGAVTLYQYSDTARTMVQRFANGLVRTSTYDATDRLISVIDSGASGPLATTRYAYDVLGRLVSVTDPNGGVRSYAYDGRGRKTAEIDATGTLTAYRYNSDDMPVSTTVYATPVDATLRAAITAGGTDRPAASAQDRHSWVFYDANNRIVKTVNGEGEVVDNVYDATGQLSTTIARGTRIDMAVFLDQPLATNASPADAPSDRITHLFHDKDGLLVGQLDAEGYLTETRYNAAGQRMEVIGYATQVPATQRDATDLASLRPGKQAQDTHAYYLYNDRGLLTQEIDGEGNATLYIYNSNGDVTGRTRTRMISPSDLSLPVLSPLQIILTGTDAASTGKPVSIYLDGLLVQTLPIPAPGGPQAVTIQVPITLLADHVLTYDAGSAAVTATFRVNGAGVSNPNRADGDMYGAGTTAKSFSFPASRWFNSTGGFLAQSSDYAIYTYDADGRLINSTTIEADRQNAVTDYVYDSEGKLVTSHRRSGYTDAVLGGTAYRYDLNGRVIAKLDGSGITVLEGLGTSASAEQIEA